MRQVPRRGRKRPSVMRHRLPAAVLVASAYAVLVCSVPAAAQDPFGIFGDFIQGATEALSSDEAGSASTAADAGSAPTAVVEEAAGISTPGIAEFSYLHAGQRIDLGSKGSMRLTYFSSCTVEAIRGGTVTIGTVSSEVTGGSVERSTTQCQAQEVVVASSATEFGASVKRVTPFDPAVWAEATVSTQTPSFAWEGGSATLRLVELDAPAPRVAWEGPVKGPIAAYPAGATPLQIGMPYRVEIDTGGGAAISVVFSVDPGFTGSNGKVDVVSIAR